MHPLDPIGGFGGGSVAAGRPFAALRAAERTAPAFGRAKPPFSLVVDLGEHRFSRDWWRGLATLTALVASVAAIAPNPFEALPSTNPLQVGEAEADQYRELGLRPLADGSGTGGRMAPNALVEPLTQAPERAQVEFYARLGEGDRIDRMLARSGVPYGDAVQAAKLIAGAGPVAPGTSIKVTLGRRGPSGARPLESLSLKSGLDKILTVAAGESGLSLQVRSLAVDATPIRVRGRVGDGLYWALRASGVSSASAGEYLRALGGSIDVGADVSPDDRFDLIIANRRSASGESQEGPLLYAALERAGAKPVRLMKWTLGGRTEWMDTTAGESRQVSSFAWPVNAPITSTFGMRYHPILHFARMHKGIDFGAAMGTPIVAAADGQVYHAGWSGGYGRQVRIAHFGGLATSYSHMSRMVVEPGTYVRQGQLIGYVGTSGLSTGPHLHYEVLKNGVAVNPMGVKFASRSLLEGDTLGAFKARLAALMKVGTRNGS